MLKIASELTNSLIKYYWTPDIGLFNNALEENIFGAPIKSATSFIPLIIDDLPIPIAATLVEDHLLNENEFWTKNPVPLIAIDENQQYFNENYWRISMPRIVINWLIIKGLFIECECVRANVSSERILANQKAKLKIAYDTKDNQVGRDSQAVYIISNDSQKPKLKITASVNLSLIHI